MTGMFWALSLRGVRAVPCAGCVGLGAWEERAVPRVHGASPRTWLPSDAGAAHQAWLGCWRDRSPSRRSGPGHPRKGKPQGQQTGCDQRTPETDY